MSTPAQRLENLGLELPNVVPPLAAYIPAKRSGNLVFTSGQLPFQDGESLALGTVGAEVTIEEAVACARQAALNAIAAAAQVVGGVDQLIAVAKCVVFVAATAEFAEHPQVANGASLLLGEIFPGGHARSAVGVASLPLQVPVEVEIIFEAAS